MARNKQLLERDFQSNLKKEILKRFPGSIVFKIERYQGYPDLMVLHGDKWAALECKQSSNAHHQPNQDYYVDKMNSMSFSRFVHSGNKKEVLDDLQRLFEV